MIELGSTIIKAMQQKTLWGKSIRRLDIETSEVSELWVANILIVVDFVAFMSITSNWTWHWHPSLEAVSWIDLDDKSSGLE